MFGVGVYQYLGVYLDMSTKKHIIKSRQWQLTSLLNHKPEKCEMQEMELIDGVISLLILLHN